MTVRETIRVKSEGDKIKRGIYRDFPTRYRDHLGTRYVVGFTVLTVLRGGNSEPYHTENISNGTRVYIGQKDVYIDPSEYTYTLEYNTVVVMVAENASAGPRTGGATIGGQTFGLTQDGQAAAVCTYSISPAAQSAGALGGPGSVSITTAAGCSWRIEAEQGAVAWIAINSGQRGAGPATIPYTIQPNQSLSSRTGEVVVHGDSGAVKLAQTVTQAAQ